MSSINSLAQSQIDILAESCKKIKPKVVIWCPTYNHELYIRDALDGFIMQKTDFPYVAIVHDDASTDLTPSIIEEYSEKYPDKIFPILEKENLYSKKGEALTLIMLRACEATGAEYIALCEGDDYWINKSKMQLQVDFLETHKDYSGCTTKFISYSVALNKIYAIVGSEYKTSYDMLWRDLQFGTATLLFKFVYFQMYLKDIQPQNKNWLMGDKPLMFYLGSCGFVANINEICCVYRILDNSASHSSDMNLQLKRARNTIDIYKFFADRYYPDDYKLQERIEGGYLYRAYLIHRKSKSKLPRNLVDSIANYKGSYPKLKVIKKIIRFPILQNIIYYIAGIRTKVKSVITKK